MVLFVEGNGLIVSIRYHDRYFSGSSLRTVISD